MSHKPETINSAILNDIGLGILEILISAGLTSALMLGTVTMIYKQQQQQARLYSKGTVSEAQAALTLALANSSVCTPQFSSAGTINVAPINTHTPKDLSGSLAVTKLYTQIGGGPAVEINKSLPTLTQGPTVKSITISEVLQKSNTDNTQYTGFLNVSFNADPRFKPDLQPMKLRFDFTTSTGALTSRTIVSCRTYALDAATTSGSGGSSIATGNSCATEGTLGYDASADVPVYCSQLLKWTKFAMPQGICANGQRARGFDASGNLICSVAGEAATPCTTGVGLAVGVTAFGNFTGTQRYCYEAGPMNTFTWGGKTYKYSFLQAISY